jgi:Domain of unknown function (DUF4282)
MSDRSSHQGLPDDWNHGSHAARGPFSAPEQSNGYGAGTAGPHPATTADGYGTGPTEAHGAAATDALRTRTDAFGVSQTDGLEARADSYGAGQADAFGARSDSSGAGQADAFGVRSDSSGAGQADAFGVRSDSSGAGQADAFGARADSYRAGKTDTFGRADSYSAGLADTFGAKADSYRAGPPGAFGVRPAGTYGTGVADPFGDADPFRTRAADPFGPAATAGFGAVTAEAGTPRPDTERPADAIGDPVTGAAADSRGFLTALFDFGFTSFVTPKVIKVLYMLIVIGTVASALVFTIIVFKASTLFGILTLVFADPLFILIVLAIYRIILEFFVVTFRVAEDIRALRERDGGEPR